jgi:hypothetical protein
VLFGIILRQTVSIGQKGRWGKVTKVKGTADKNLSNVAEDLDRNPVNSHHAQQLQQDVNDRRHQDLLNHDEETDLKHPRS